MFLIFARYHIFVIVMLLMASFGNFKYGFYITLKIIVTFFCLGLAYKSFGWLFMTLPLNSHKYFKYSLLPLLVLGILYNPIIRFPLGRDLWEVINIVTAVFFLTDAVIKYRFVALLSKVIPD